MTEDTEDLMKTLLAELAEEQEKIEKQFDIEMDEWWNAMSKEDQMKAFYSVVKRIVDGELVEKGSYRYILYDVFGFGPESYMIALNAGFVALHNSIERDVEKFT